ncbi:uncharacterized protein [Zea mays]|uniref:uncharacterized protein n=1 Tax=Zea mays TaxID=4577 RepID=UPI0009AA3E76|nr:uncharacterized protein LOC103645435 [Zea mays]|eukprot:XP_008666711.2 uncharacterized protein LOC103645435 [Zea mays]
MEKTAEDLSFDVLWLIFANLELPDLVRAGSVCSIWRDIYTSLCNSGSYNPQHTPCLLYTSESASARAACLYSLAEKKTYTLTLPDPPLRSRYIFGSSYGWIATADERSELHIVNPITGDQIALPSVITIEWVKPIFSDTGAICGYEHSGYFGVWITSGIPSIFDLSELRDYLFYKVFLSSDPSAGEYFVVLIHNPHCQLSFARAGDDRWTLLPHGDSYEDCLFNGRLLYACTRFGEIHEFDLGTPAMTHKILLDRVKDIYDEKIYIVQASCGELLQIWSQCLACPGTWPGLASHLHRWPSISTSLAALSDSLAILHAAALLVSLATALRSPVSAWSAASCAAVLEELACTAPVPSATVYAVAALLKSATGSGDLCVRAVAVRAVLASSDVLAT